MGNGRVRSYCLMDIEFLSGMMKNFRNSGDGCVNYKCTWCHWIAHLKIVKMVYLMLGIFLPQ